MVDEDLLSVFGEHLGGLEDQPRYGRQGRHRRFGGGHVLGAMVIASRAGETIGELALAMRAGMFTGRLAQTTHAYPTWSLGIQQAAAQFFSGYAGRTARPAGVGEQQP